MLKKNNLVLLVAVLIMIAAALWLEKKETQNELNLQRDLKLNPNEIQSFKIERPEITLDFHKTAQSWLLASGLSADNTYVNDLLEKMAETPFEVISPPDTQLNFEKPAARVILPEQTLILSERKNFEGRAYAQLNNEIVLSQADLDQLILNKPIYFQNKHLFKYFESEIDTIQIESLNEKFKIEKYYIGLDTKLRNMTVQEYFYKPHVLKKPIVKIFAQGPQVKWQMSLSLDAQDKKLYAEILDQDKVYHVEFDTSYWAYFANLSRDQFVLGGKK